MAIERNIRHGPYGRHTIATANNEKHSRILGKGWTVREGVWAEHYKFGHCAKRENILHERTFAEKRYASERLLRRVLSKYLYCRDAGLPVAVTLGVDENDPGTVIASDLSCGGKFLVESANIRQNDVSTNVRIGRIVGLSSLAKRIARTGALAAAKGIHLTGDAVFFRLPAVGGIVSIDFAIGDFDNPHFAVNDEDISSTRGLENAWRILNVFLAWVRGWPTERMPNAASHVLKLEAILASSMKKEFPKAFALAEKLGAGARRSINHDRVIELKWGRQKKSHTRPKL